MSFNKISATALQKMANQLLSMDTEAQGKLTSLNGKTIHIQVTDLTLDYYFSFIDSQLLIEDKIFEKDNNQQNPSNATDSNISASISGNLSAFIAAIAAEHSADPIFTGELHFSGEINTAKHFQTFVQTLDIDWSEPLAQTFGDPIGHTLAKGLQKLSGCFFNTANSVKQDVSDYLQEEARVTPGLSEQQHFFQQVDQLRSQTDRLSAKISQLHSQQTESKESL